jgi:hypothetical protein
MAPGAALAWGATGWLVVVLSALQIALLAGWVRPPVPPPIVALALALEPVAADVPPVYRPGPGSWAAIVAPRPRPR